MTKHSVSFVENLKLFNQRRLVCLKTSGVIEPYLFMIHLLKFVTSLIMTRKNEAIK